MASVLGPVTVATALLYYYGYVTTYAEFGYFGIDVELLDFSPQDYVLRSPASLFAPALVLLLVAAACVVGYGAARRWKASGRRPHLLRVVACLAIFAGCVLAARGLAGVVNGRISRDEMIGTSPGAMGVGTLLVLAGVQLLRRAAPRGKTSVTAVSNSNVTLAATWTIGWCLVVLSLFWLVNSLAGAYGRGQAMRVQDGLGDRPEVVLHTKGRLFVDARGTASVDLCERSIDGGEFGYRYINLRLLAVSDDDLFLVPVTWSPEEGVVIQVSRSDVQLQYLEIPEAVSPCT